MSEIFKNIADAILTLLGFMCLAFMLGVGFTTGVKKAFENHNIKALVIVKESPNE